jgi:TctA family transporter
MDFLSNLELGASVAFSLHNLIYCFVGVTLGTAIGVLPGVGPVLTISLLLPMTFGLPVEGSIIMLAGIYYGAQYGGSTTSILLNVPGETSSVVTCLDGYQMARRGQAGVALSIAACSSLLAGIFSTIIIAAFAPWIGAMAIRFGSPEYFSLLLFSMTATAMMVRGSSLKGLMMALLGIFLGTIGTDLETGTIRFSFGIRSFEDGLEMVVVAMGLFAFTEIISNLIDPEFASGTVAKIENLRPTRAEIRQALPASIRGTLLGSALGILPGGGAAVSSFVAYLVEKKVSRTPERFGTGAIEGVAAPEAANNAAAQTAFIPTLTLGLPGGATMALMLGALLIQGIAPGPQVISKYPNIFWGLVVSMLIGNIMLVILNLPMVGFWVKLLKVPYRWLFPGIIVIGCMGIYSINNNASDVVIAGGIAFLGLILTKLGCEPMPLILGFVLGPLFEENLRRSLLIAHGDPTIFIRQPISAAFIIITSVMLLLVLFPSLRRFTMLRKMSKDVQENLTVN